MSLDNCKLKTQWDTTTHIFKKLGPKKYYNTKCWWGAREIKLFIAEWNAKWHGHFGCGERAVQAR